MASETTIQSLNDDCLLRIFDFLNLSDEGRIRAVCSRFNNLILYHWRLRYRAYKSQGLRCYTTELKWVVFCLGTFVEHLDLYRVTRRELRYLKKCGFIFPCMRKLSLFVHTHDSDYMTDRFPYCDPVDDMDVMQIVAHTFPHLTHLSVNFKYTLTIDLKSLHELRKLNALALKFLTQTGVINFRVFAKLDLKWLRLDADLRLLSFEEEDVDNLRQVLNCSSLEELELSEDILKLVMGGFHRLPKLWKVTCVGLDSCDVFSQVLAALSKRAIAVISSSAQFDSFSFTDLRHFQNVQKLIICTHHLEAYDCFEIADKLGNLRELHFINNNNDLYHVKPSSVLLNVVSGCLKLEILAVPIFWVNKYISIAELIRILERQTNRKGPLQLCCLRQKQ